MSLSGTIRAGAAYVEVTAQTSKLQRGLATAQAQLQNFGRSCTAIGKDMLMLSGAFAVPMAMAVKGFADFDDQMRLVRAVTKATKQEFESLTQVAAKLGRETSFTAKQVADGMVSLGRMGFSPKEIEQAIQPTLDLARATGTDLGEAANIAANSMRIFGIEASKMSDVADILTATANGSAQTLTDLFEALKMAGPQAKAAGENITDTSAALGVLANLGIKGSLAGTALRKSFSQFAKTKVQDKLKAVGISTVDANGNLRKMAEIIADIGRVMATMPSAEKLAFAEDIFDIRGSLAGLSLGGNVKELDAFIERLYDVKGTARTTAQEMDAGLGGSFRKLLSAVEGAMNAIGKALEGTLKPFIDKITATTLAVIKWIEANSGLVTAFAATIAGTAALGAALIVIGVAAKGAAAGFAVIQTAIKGFTFIQGVCIAQGVALRNSISLIGAAFVNFRNVAIPAMVGTEQLCAAFGLASTAANRTAASIVLMSNAEAAATAKSILAAKWTAMTGALKAFRTSAIAATIATKAQAAAEAAMAAKGAIVAGWVAMTNALKGMTLATAAATISTYAHTAAEAICTAGTIALNRAREIAIATTALFTAANFKAVLSISAVTVGNFLLAAAAKVAAVAMMALSAVMTLIAAHPVAAALIALGIILAGVCIYLYRAANYTAKLSDEAGKLREKNDELRKTDQLRMERLKQLSEKQKLTNAEMAEARQLAKELRSRYGDLGITISNNTVRVKELDSAAKRLGAVQLRVENAEDMEKLKRLKELSLKVNLSVPERNEAAGLIEDLSGRYGDLGMEVDRTKKRIILLTAAAQRLQGIRLVTRVEEPDLAKFDKLKSLSLETKLTFEQQGDAEALIAELSEKYGDLGIIVNRTTGQIERLNIVAGSIADLTFRVRGTEDIEKLQRLKQLSLEADLTVEGQQEAARLIAELTAKYGDLGLAVETTGAKVAAVNDAVAHMNRVRVAVDDRDLEKFNRLKALTQIVRLDVQGQEEAESLIGELSERYGDLGLAIDRATGKIVQLNTVAGNLKTVELTVTDKIDLAKIHDLQGMSLQAELTVSGMDSAERMIAELERKYGSLGVTVDRASRKIVALNDAASRVRNIELGVTDNGDLEKLARLRNLSLRAELDVRGQAEAETLIADLSKQYGDLGLAVDKTTGKVVRMNTVVGNLREARFKIRTDADLKQLDRLKELSLETTLSVEGQDEASRIIAELTEKYGILGVELDRTTGRIQAVNTEAAKVEGIKFRVNADDLKKFDRLKALTQVVRLDVQGQQEAETLIAELSKRYGDLGIVVDKVSGKIVRMNTAAGNLRAVELTVTDKVDLGKIHDLQGMSLQAQMTVSGMDSAERMIGELEEKYGSLGVAVDRTTGKIVAMTEAASRVRNIELSVSDGGDLEKLTRLRTLSMQAHLDVQGQSEAEALIAALSKRYGDLGVAVDRASGKIVRMNTVAGRLQDVRFRINDEVDLKKFDRLKKLSAEIVLTTEGQAEAEKLVSELSAKYGNLGITVDKTAVRIAALNAEAARIATVELEVKDTGDLTKLRKLKALSLEVKLDVDRQNEAEALISDLSRKYGDLGVTVDRATGKIVRLNSVAASLREIRIKVSGTEDADKAARLQALATMPKLDSSGISEANTLIEQLKAKYGDLGLAVDATNGRIVALTEAQRKFAEAQDIIKAGNDPLKETHLAQLERLKKLTEQEKLTAAEQAEAQSIVNALNGAYNGLGLGIDAITGKLKLAAGAQQQLNDAMKKATLAELDAEIAELEANIRELGKENESLMSYWNHNLMSQITGRQQEAVNKIEANGDKMAVMRQKIGALRQRKQAVEQDKPGATTGTDGKPGTTTAENIEAEKQRRQQSQDAADEAAKRVAEIDKKLARERKTDLENEIDDINALRDEYKALIQTMLDYEKSKPEGQQDKAKIADLEGKLRQADVTARERIAKAQEKAAEKMKKDVADFQRSFEDAEKSVRERRAEDAQDRQIDSTLKSDKDAGIQMLEGLIQQYRQAAEAARQQFQRELQAAQADGKIDDNERERISAAQAAYTRAESLVDKYSDKLRSAQDGTESAADRSQTTGSFLAAALTQALGGGGNEAERTANATEQMARTTKETNKILKKMGRGGSSESTLAYT